MMIHEGIPGHHLQLASAAEHSSYIRRISSFNEFSEGWTTMLEDYMLDIGYCEELKDELRFNGKREIARLAARVAIDLYFMSGDKSYLEIGVDCDFSSDDPFENAALLLQTVTGFSDARVKGEISWYSQERGYPLSYLTGNYLTWQLKEKFAAKHPELTEFDLDRKFHKQFLEAGNMSLALFEKVLLN